MFRFAHVRQDSDALTHKAKDVPSAADQKEKEEEEEVDQLVSESSDARTIPADRGPSHYARYWKFYLILPTFLALAIFLFRLQDVHVDTTGPLNATQCPEDQVRLQLETSRAQVGSPLKLILAQQDQP